MLIRPCPEKLGGLNTKLIPRFQMHPVQVEIPKELGALVRGGSSVELTKGGKVVAIIVAPPCRERARLPSMTFAEFERTHGVSRPKVDGVHPSVLLTRERRGE